MNTCNISDDTKRFLSYFIDCNVSNINCMHAMNFARKDTFGLHLQQLKDVYRSVRSKKQTEKNARFVNKKSGFYFRSCSTEFY